MDIKPIEIEFVMQPCSNCIFFQKENETCELNLDVKRAVMTGKCKKKEEIDISDTK